MARGLDPGSFPETPGGRIPRRKIRAHGLARPLEWPARHPCRAGTSLGAWRLHRRDRAGQGLPLRTTRVPPIAFGAASRNNHPRSSSPTSGGRTLVSRAVNASHVLLILAGLLLGAASADAQNLPRSEEQTSELQYLKRISYAVLCLKKTKTTN